MPKIVHSQASQKGQPQGVAPTGDTDCVNNGASFNLGKHEGKHAIE